MDKNQAIGLILISVILGVYMYLAPSPEPTENEPVTTENVIDSSKTNSSELVATVDTNTNDSIVDLENKVLFGAFAPFVNQSEKLIEVENNTTKFTFSSKGGQIKQVELKDYQTYSKEPLILFDATTRKEVFNFQTKDGKNINLNALNFSTPTSSNVKVEKDSTVITFNVQLANNQFIEKQYTIYSDKYEVGYKLHFNGVENIINTNSLQVSVIDFGKHFEKDVKQSRNRSTINYMLTNEDFDYLTERSTEEQKEEIENVQWISHKQKFFSKAIIAKSGIAKATVLTRVNENSEFTKEFKSDYTLDYQTLNTGKENFILYYGPNKYSILEDIGYEMERNIYLGIPLIRQINQFIILPLFNVLSSLFSNFGLVIFLLVLIIKTAIFPFTFKSYKGFAKMRVLKPELDELKEEFGDDNTKYQQEQMKVYQKFGVSPLSGCIPMVFQMPFLFALFQLFPSAIELRGQSFLWAEDLSSYDAFFTWSTEIWPLGNHISLFTLLMTCSTIAYTYVSQQVTPTSSAPGQPNMKVMSYMMPLVFFFVLNDYASGLTYYYFLSNIITMSQQLLSKRFIDEKKIRAKMQEHGEKNKGKKKNSFSKRLEEAMKAQQEKNKKK